MPDPIGSGSFGHVYQINWNGGESKALKLIQSGMKTIKVSKTSAIKIDCEYSGQK